MSETKICVDCGKELPLTHFYQYNARPGYYSRCKPCQLDRNKRWRLANPEKYAVINRAGAKRWQQKNRKKVNEWHRDYLVRTKTDRLDNTLTKYFDYLKTIPEVTA